MKGHNFLCSMHNKKKSHWHLTTSFGLMHMTYRTVLKFWIINLFGSKQCVEIIKQIFNALKSFKIRIVKVLSTLTDFNGQKVKLMASSIRKFKCHLTLVKYQIFLFIFMWKEIFLKREGLASFDSKPLNYFLKICLTQSHKQRGTQLFR